LYVPSGLVHQSEYPPVIITALGAHKEIKKCWSNGNFLTSLNSLKTLLNQCPSDEPFKLKKGSVFSAIPQGYFFPSKFNLNNAVPPAPEA